ncbi:MAG: 50S ribosomal protein L21 [Elusimicrobiota bacterium]
MYAIIETGGKQYWVVPGEMLKVEKLAGKKGDTITFAALWTADEEKAESSSREGKVTAEIVRQTRGDKIIVFKKKPKSNYSRRAGHRQSLTEIRVTKISLN